MMNVEQEIAMLPVLLVEAILNHDFFMANQIKRREEELKNWINMNGGGGCNG